jgi:hypothetical protein
MCTIPTISPKTLDRKRWILMEEMNEKDGKEEQFGFRTFSCSILEIYVGNKGAPSLPGEKGGCGRG